MQRFGFGIILVLAACLWHTTVLAHSRLVQTDVIHPRDTNDANKSGPCGVGSQATAPTVILSGSSIDIQWIETINHYGVWYLYLSTDGDTGFDDPNKHRLLKSYDDLDDVGISRTHPKTYSKNIALPDIECTQCVIQLIQEMRDRTPASNYYSCADVVLSKTGTTPTPAPAPAPTPPTDLTFAQLIVLLKTDFNSFDDDSDSYLSLSETQVHITSITLSQFEQIDGNHDGYLSLNEVVNEGKIDNPVNTTGASAKTVDDNKQGAGSMGSIMLVLLSVIVLFQFRLPNSRK